MMSRKATKLIYKEPLMCRLGRTPRRKNEGVLRGLLFEVGLFGAE
jgi:hypothetical protein